MRFTPRAEYAFRHPLIRTVAYESQLKSDRAVLHRLLAADIASREPEAADQNAALIAEHLEAAGDLHAAYGWHMRAATWATNRDIAAAQLSWERAVKIADALPAADPNRAAMRIAPRTMLCGIAWRVHEHVAGARFDELRQLCNAAGDNASLAIATAGLVVDHAYQDRMREASQLASEAMALIESVGDPTLTVGLSMPVVYAKIECGEWPDVLRWSQRLIDLADGDPSKGNFIVGPAIGSASGGAERTTVWWCATSGCCDCGLCWRGHTATPRLTRSAGINTAIWPSRSASRGIATGPRPCHDRVAIPANDDLIRGVHDQHVDLGPT